MSAAPSDRAEYTVGAVAARLGIPSATLRSWNQRYGVGPQRHRPGRHRLYTETDIAVAGRMLELIKAGASPASAARAANGLRAQVPPVGEIGPLLSSAFRLDTAEVLSTLEAHLSHHGVVATWDRLCRPAFADIVARQYSGHGCIDVEHLLSWAVATSLHRAVPPLPTGPQPVILACSSGDTHSLPLEALRAALAERQIGVHMLGAAVPTDALIDALARSAAPATVVLWAQRTGSARLSAIRAALDADARVMAAGPGWSSMALPDPAVMVHDLTEALQLLS
jgi:MerR family transcriptional regulator, light-induced transcriptional regulator